MRSDKERESDNEMGVDHKEFLIERRFMLLGPYIGMICGAHCLVTGHGLPR